MKSLIVLSLLISQISWAQTEVKEFDAKIVRSLDLESLNGSVRIEGGHEDKVTIRVEKIEFTKSCRLEMDLKGSEVKAKVSRKGAFKKSDCTTHFTVQLPKVFDLDLKVGSGDIDVKGTRGELEFKMGSGHITVDADVLELEGSSGSGDIVIKSVSGKTELSMGSGTAKITYLTVPEIGKFDLKSGSGLVELTMPANAKIQTNFVSFGGKMTNEIGDTKDAKFKVSVKSGAGNLHIKKALE